MSIELPDLKSFRKTSGKTQKTLAAKVGVSQQAIQRLESGKVDLRLSSLSKYAEAIGYEVKIILKKKIDV